VGRLLDRPGPSKLESKTWKSRGNGSCSIAFLPMEGRISIDIFPLIKRDHKLSTYTLDAVSRNFLGRGKHDVKPVEMFRIYESMVAAAAPTPAPTPTSAPAPAPAPRPNIEAAMNDVWRVVDYCFEDALLVGDLFDKLLIWFDLTSFSAEMGVTIVEVVTRGQQIRCQAMLYDLASRSGYVMTKRCVDTIHAAGGHVGNPQPGLYDNIIVVDFASMYPSIIRAFNLCYSIRSSQSQRKSRAGNLPQKNLNMSRATMTRTMMRSRTTKRRANPRRSYRPV
jgi:DNA polymerase delta subunit 1